MMMWAPSPGQYREGLAWLRDCDLVDAAAAAEAEVGHALLGAGGQDPLWTSRAGAVVVYAMWALKELRTRETITEAEFRHRLGWLAGDVHGPRTGVQRLVHQREGPESWVKPSWWSTSDVHTEHRALLLERAPDHYQPTFADAGFGPYRPAPDPEPIERSATCA